jgi:hypothetical protein
MDNILAEVEGISASIHADLSVLPGDTKDSLLSEYGRAAQQALVRIIESLETLGNAYHSLEGNPAASLFLARLATQIAHNHLDANICGSSALLGESRLYRPSRVDTALSLLSSSRYRCGQRRLSQKAACFPWQDGCRLA